MKLALSIPIFIVALFILGDESFSLTDYQIRRFCKKEKKELVCIKNLKQRKFNLQKGNLIEIPVIPYKR